MNKINLNVYLQKGWRELKLLAIFDCKSFDVFLVGINSRHCVT